MSDHITIASRLFRRVTKTDACWVWNGGKTDFGHGRIKVNGKLVSAHCLSWELHNGPIPTGMLILHDCDNPACVNPAHLHLGTHADNMRECYRRGRSPLLARTPATGERNGAAKLTAAQVLEIRTRAKSASGYALSKEYGISKSTMYGILNGKLWAHLQEVAS